MAQRGARSRCARSIRLLLGVALAVPLTGSTPADPEPPTGAPEGVARDEALLSRPGAALRAALQADAAGDPERAEQLLAAVAERHPIVTDYAELLRMKLRVDGGRIDAAIAMRETRRYPTSPLRAEFYELLGQAHASRGDEEAARAAWELALGESNSSARSSELRLAVAQSQLRAGELEAAAESLLEIWTRYPLSPADEQAVEQLEILDETLAKTSGKALRSALQLRRRGDALFRKRRNEEALAVYDLALASVGLDEAEQRRMLQQRAHTLFRLRRYSDAALAYAELPPDAETRISWARSIARGGDPARGARELERIGRDTPGSRGARATLLAALLLEGEGDEERARALYASLVRSASRTAAGGVALWKLGWAAYRDGRNAAAMGYFEKLRDRNGDAIGQLRARYWHARAAANDGRPEAAAAFARLAREFPLSYYGWRSRVRAPAQEVEIESVQVSRGTSALSPVDLARATILLEAGLDEWAEDELDRLFVRARGLEDRLALAELYANAGNFHRAQRLMVDAYTETLARGPLPVPVEIWWHAWPVPFADEVRGATVDGTALDEELVYAVMREESGYRPEVLSVSGARGLLQLMPETAERVARRVELDPFSADDLFLPGINIQLGSAYLVELLGRFSGRASAAIGSYNAGPHRVTRWLDGELLEDDEWVEEIPYDQTRSYVKRVLRSVHAYRVLY
jgi:soluble lytic murein transglycosylase